MKRVHARWLVRLYPPAWRARYGAELEALLESEPARPLILLDLIRAAAVERAVNLSGQGAYAMSSYPASVLAMVRRPSAFLPIVMSLLALALVLVFLMREGATPSGPPHDEEGPARLFHLLLAGQFPLLAFFALRWVPKDWRAALSVLALQFLAIAAAAAVPISYHW